MDEWKVSDGKMEAAEAVTGDGEGRKALSSDGEDRYLTQHVPESCDSNRNHDSSDSRELIRESL